VGGDQFSRTLGSDSVGRIEQVDQSTTINPVSPVAGKKVETRGEVPLRDVNGHRLMPTSSTLIQPKPELWNTAIEAVERFNEHLDVRKMQFSIRIWAQNSGFRIQLIRDKCGTLIKQTETIPFLSVTGADLNNIINSLIQEHGVVIDLMR